MRYTLLLTVLVTSMIAEAGEKIVTRSRDTGKEQVLSVGDCDIPSKQEKDVLDQIHEVSDFSLTVCKQTVTYQVKVVTDDKWYTWDSEETVIPGSERYTYSVQTIEKRSSEPYNPQDALQPFRVAEDCQNYREGYVKQVVPLTESNCVQ